MKKNKGQMVQKLYYIHGFCDASFTPYRFNGRRGLTGGALFVEGSLIRSTARQQQSVALSSCESELFALQTVTQEAVGSDRTCARGSMLVWVSQHHMGMCQHIDGK